MKVPAIIKPFYSYLYIDPYYIIFNMRKVLFKLTKSDISFKRYNEFKSITKENHVIIKNAECSLAHRGE